ncbi:hypothetical protein F4801DRAFT_575762 [Xylaria longipes]|nr:hypothetical protein F4801DRAFT_575762 [Xylaria longipes]
MSFSAGSPPGLRDQTGAHRENGVLPKGVLGLVNMDSPRTDDDVWNGQHRRRRIGSCQAKRPPVSPPDPSSSPRSCNVRNRKALRLNEGPPTNHQTLFDRRLRRLFGIV